jgi:hypothetical protein
MRYDPEMDRERSEKHSGLGGGIPTNRDGYPVALPSWSWPGIIVLCSISATLGYGFVILIKWII